ncbi:YggS family pyridoxal phosphate-dependent enzyme [bacterium]|nr:YggS family pyridoxal phosphate-dependent enzyme [bacterium]
MNGNVISNNLTIARQKIGDARKVSGVEDVVIVGITKTRTAQNVVDLIEAGCSTIGENRVQEWENKYPLVLDEMKARGINSKFTCHLVGNLQSNKAKRAVKDFDFIQSLHSIKLAQRISRIIEESNKEPLQCLIQVKLGEEETKSGIGKAELLRDFEQFIGLKSIRISGLMLIAPLWGIGEEARPYYNEMHELFQSMKKQEDSRFEMKYLSMGMSADFDVAVEEGANMVRIGRALFDGFDNL